MTYPNTQLFIDGQWQDAADGRSLAVFNPASGKEIGRVAHAGKADLDKALAAAQKGFETWRDMPPADRAKIMRKAAGLIRERAGEIAPLLTQEQGKPLAEAKGETLAAADLNQDGWTDWVDTSPGDRYFWTFTSQPSTTSTNAMIPVG